MTYPSAPAFLAPVRVPVVKAGQPMRSVAAATGAALAQANGRLAKSRSWYLGISGGRK